jgi:hypothetical protein
MEESTMIKKALIAAIAAGALSVSLAGVAWADTPDTDGAGIGAGGVPVKAERILEQNGVPVVGKVTPGAGSDRSVAGIPDIPGVSDIASLPGSVPDVYSSFGAPNPGALVKAITPGCASGSLGCQ